MILFATYKVKKDFFNFLVISDRFNSLLIALLVINIKKQSISLTSVIYLSMLEISMPNEVLLFTFYLQKRIF